MNRFFKTLSVALAFGLAFTFAACDEKPDTPKPDNPNPDNPNPDNPNPDNPTKALTYTASELPKASVGAAYEGSVATATGASSITYILKSGTLPDGLTLGTEGKITGTPTEETTAEFTVSASATGYTSAEAAFRLTVGPEKLSIPSEITAEAPELGVYYTALVNAATGADDVTYAVSNDTSLPEGLSLDPKGLLYGTVTAAQQFSFKLVASAEGNDPVTATVNVRPKRGPAAPSQDGQVNFANVTAKGAVQGQLFALLNTSKDTIAKATVTNGAVVKYALAEGETMPEGLKLYENGTIFGVPAAATSSALKINLVATAERCEEAKARLTINIAPPPVPYAKFIKLETAMVGEAYTADLGTSSAEGVTYSVATGTFLPAGLSLSSDGKLTGTPTASARAASFGVTASAEGYSPFTCSVSIPIRDRKVTVENGKFEAELIDLTGKSGGGYSGSASQEEMVQKNESASNGFFIGYTHAAGTYEFKFEASQAASGVKLEIGLGSELQGAVFTSKEFGIYVNGVEIAYTVSLNPKSNGTAVGEFVTYTIATNLTLNAGENVVMLMVKPNTLMKGTSTGGPCIDFIQLTTSATLSWTPCLYNLAGK